MNRHFVSIRKSEEYPKDNTLWLAESNSPDEKLRLSGNPEVLEAVKIFLEMLPPTYTKQDALDLMNKAVDEVYL